MHKTVRMLTTEYFDSERNVKETYIRKMSPSEYEKRSAHLAFEGVDGDEETNTVTYWYKPLNKENEE
jgi:hypothetical protein